MNISFDLDDTLIIHNPDEYHSKKLLNGEILRNGSIELLKELEEQHIYNLF